MIFLFSIYLDYLVFFCDTFESFRNGGKAKIPRRALLRICPSLHSPSVMYFDTVYSAVNHLPINFAVQFLQSWCLQKDAEEVADVGLESELGCAILVRGKYSLPSIRTMSLERAKALQKQRNHRKIKIIATGTWAHFC